MTHEQVIELTNEYRQQLEVKIKIGYVASVAVFALDDSTHAECITNAYYNEFWLHFNSSYIESGDDKEVKKTIVHELVHCCKSRHGHNRSFWRAYYKACNILNL
jgi:predicted SprT family Zn-dependent metalloprotease